MKGHHISLNKEKWVLQIFDYLRKTLEIYVLSKSVVWIIDHKNQQDILNAPFNGIDIVIFLRKGWPWNAISKVIGIS